MSMPHPRLDDVARLLGIPRRDLDAEVALAGVAVRGTGKLTAFESQAALMAYLLFRARVAGQASDDSPEREALKELLELSVSLEQAARERDRLSLELVELRRLLHKVVVENVQLTARVNELSIVRMRPRSVSASGASLWSRWLDRLFGRTQIEIPAGRNRRAA
ncbi:MAG: hypothetical protein HY814_05320 [Candidatus Riflebacteria bacterium]|nr:hypothetical protein [Candidatus Riflebacteria bacterium]